MRVRRAMMMLASASGRRCDRPAGRRDEDTVREVIHRFNEIGLAAWTLGGREAVPA